MEQMVTVIGGADGPTSIFLEGQLGPSWFHIGGFLLVVLMLVPNCIYAWRHKDMENMCQNKWMNLVEQIGRYGCMFFMVFSVGIGEMGGVSVEDVKRYVIGNALLMLGYWFVWILYLKKESFGKEIMLAVIPVGIFLISGITRHQIILILLSFVFAWGHIYVTVKNRKK